MTAAAFVTLLGRGSVGHAFSQSPSVNRHIASIAAYTAIFQTIDGYQGTLAGVLRGAGWAKQVALINALGWWVVALPSAAFFAHGMGHGLIGVWQGMLLGNAALATCYTLLYWRTDWEGLAAASSSSSTAASIAAGNRGASDAALPSSVSQQLQLQMRTPVSKDRRGSGSVIRPGSPTDDDGFSLRSTSQELNMSSVNVAQRLPLSIIDSIPSGQSTQEVAGATAAGAIAATPAANDRGIGGTAAARPSLQLRALPASPGPGSVSQRRSAPAAAHAASR